jgi:formylglycine-generating enzyme required for sulfatase activity
MRQALHPHFWSWWDMGPGSWLWGWTMGRGPFQGVPSTAEHHLGIGFLTPLVCAAGLSLGRDRPVCRLAALMLLILWFTTTFLPGDQVALLAAGASFCAVGGLFYERDDPRSRAIGLAFVVGLLLLIRLPNPYLLVLGLTVMVLCVLELHRLRGDFRAQVVPGLALAALGLKWLPLPVLWNGVILIVPAAGLLAYYFRSRWWDIGVGALAVLLLFAALITWFNKPLVLAGVLVAAPLSLAWGASRSFRPPAWLLLRTLIIALPLVALFFDRSSLWLDFFWKVPGGIAIRAIGRVVLIMLIPLALGLATLVQRLDQRRWVVAGGILTLLCLVEQGVTTESFDAATNRATVEKIARQVDRDRAAFYYHPPNHQTFYHLDAMWASLASRVPTINGYSGYAPREWEGFIATEGELGMDAGEVLRDWEQAERLAPERVQWIGRERPVMGIMLCWCPPGQFTMGSPTGEPERRPDESQVEVRLTRGFWIGKYEVTQGDWKRVVGKLPGTLSAELPEGDSYPVGNVNFAEAEEFCRKLTDLAIASNELTSDWEFRLPTEAQWEYACRAGTTTATAFGDSLSRTQANFQGKPYNSAADDGPSLKRAARVGSYPPNAWGIHDMHGNTFEWCRDWYHPILPGGNDPDLYSAKATSRVRRGGCWTDDGWPCRSAFRLRFEPERRYDHIGFRVVVVRRTLSRKEDGIPNWARSLLPREELSIDPP